MSFRTFFEKLKGKYLHIPVREMENLDMNMLVKSAGSKGGFINKITGGRVDVDNEGFVEEQDLVKNFLGGGASKFVTAIAGDFSFDDENDDNFFGEKFDFDVS